MKATLTHRVKTPAFTSRREKQLSSKVIIQLMGTTIFINKVGIYDTELCRHIFIFKK